MILALKSENLPAIHMGRESILILDIRGVMGRKMEGVELHVFEYCISVTNFPTLYNMNRPARRLCQRPIYTNPVSSGDSINNSNCNN